MADILPLRTAPALTDSPSESSAAILVSAKQAAKLLSIGLRTFRSMDASGRIPAPVRLSAGCVHWRAAELRDWAESGAPDRTKWAEIRAAKRCQQ